MTTSCAAEGVIVSHRGFLFCKWTVAAALIAALIFRLEWVVVACAAILLFNAAGGIGRAPLLMLGGALFSLFPGDRSRALDPREMRFTHIAGGAALALSSTLIYLEPWRGAGWTLLTYIAVFKALGAMGFCGATCLYRSMFAGGSCCSAYLARMRKQGWRA